MFNAAIGLFVLAIIAALLGFGGIAGTAAGLAKIAFFVFIILAVLGFFMGRGRSGVSQTMNRNAVFLAIGLTLTALGAVGLVIEGVSWSEQETIVDVGPIQASATVERSRDIPLWAAGGALGVGLLLVIVGVARRD